MTPTRIQERVGEIKAAMQVWNDELFGVGHVTQRIHWTASISIRSNGGTIDPDITPEGLVAFAAEMAANDVYFCLQIGKGPNISVSPENLADIFEAAVVDGHCYMMARTKELRESNYIDVYKPHMDAVIARAAEMSTAEVPVAPPKVMLCGKGPIFSTMDPTQAATYFPAYKDVLVPGVENSNVTVLDWSFSERAGLWLNGDVKSWGCNSIGDNLAANRVAEYGGMRNGHVVLRHLLSQYALGADVFRITSIQGQENPLFTRGDTTDPEYSSAYRQGIFNFLKLVETGVYPNTPDRSQLKGVSPVAAALYDPDYQRLRDQSINHEYQRYEVPAADYVINNLACWAAYTDVPDFDATAILFNTTRRWDNLLPTSPSGFVAMVPYATRAELESNGWCKRAYETDGNTWDEFGSLTSARDSISANLEALKFSQLFYVENECFWQVAQEKDDPTLHFVMLMDSNTLTPTDRTVKLRKRSAAGIWQVYDQLGSPVTPIGTLTDASDFVEVQIPAGSVRFLMLQKVVPVQSEIIGVGWHTPEDAGSQNAVNDATPDTAFPGVIGLLGALVDPSNTNEGGGREWLASPSGSDSSYGSLAIPLPLAEESAIVSLRSRRDQDRFLDIAITNNTGSSLAIAKLHFDFRLISDTSGLDSIRVEHLASASDLSDGDVSLFSTTGLVLGEWVGVDVDLASLMYDSTLLGGETGAFRISIPDNDGYDRIAIDNVAISIAAEHDFISWAAGYGLYGANALASADFDADGLDNLSEYALGGNPTASGDFPSSTLAYGVDAPVDTIDFSYNRRKDFSIRGLNYTVQTSSNFTGWDDVVLPIEASNSIDSEFDRITHRLPTESFPLYIRLQVSDQ